MSPQPEPETETEPGPELVEIGRPALPLVAALHAECFPEQPWSEAALAGLWGNPGTFGWIAALGGEPAGFVVARLLADEAEILTLGVRPGARRRGLAAHLVRAAAASARTAGARRMHLEVAESNAAARATYGRSGFAEAGRRRGYYRSEQGAAVDALLLALRLDT